MSQANELANFAASPRAKRVLQSFAISLTNPISKLKPTEIKNLGRVIDRWTKMLGLKNAMSKEMVIMNAGFLVRSFGHLSLEDLENAIEMSLDGTLEVDPKLYGEMFAPMYMSKILNAYQVYRKKEVLAARSAFDARKIKNAPEVIKTPEELAENMRVCIAQSYKAAINNKPILDTGNLIWKFMDANGFIQGIELSDQDKYVIEHRAKSQFTADNSKGTKKINAEAITGKDLDYYIQKFTKAAIIKKILLSWGADTIQGLTIEQLNKKPQP